MIKKAVLFGLRGRISAKLGRAGRGLEGIGRGFILGFWRKKPDKQENKGALK